MLWIAHAVRVCISGGPWPYSLSRGRFKEDQYFPRGSMLPHIRRFDERWMPMVCAVPFGFPSLRNCYAAPGRIVTAMRCADALRRQPPGPARTGARGFFPASARSRQAECVPGRTFMMRADMPRAHADAPDSGPPFPPQKSVNRHSPIALHAPDDSSSLFPGRRRIAALGVEITRNCSTGQVT
jgi:hypothetical protein